MGGLKNLILVLLRLAMGGMFFYSGVDKLLNEFTASGFLTKATSGPFSEIYMSMAGNGTVDMLVIWGEIMIGVALILGIFARFASYMGSLMMLLFYLAVLPPEHGYISEHIIYILVFGVIAIFATGRKFGVDKYIERHSLVKKHRYFKLLLG